MRGAQDARFDRNDPLLAPVLRAKDAAERELAIGHVLTASAIPIIERVVAGYRSADRVLAPEDAEDIRSIVVIRLLRKIHALLLFEDEAIQHFEDFVATLSFHAVYDFLRSRFPERTRLRNRLRYVLMHDTRFEIWTGVAGTACCALRGTNRTSSPLADVQLGRHEVPATALNPSDPAGSIAAVLARIGRPVTFDALFRLVFDLWEIVETRWVDLDGSRADQAPSALDRTESREFLDQVWAEVSELPLRQRVALLLNLRDADGMNALALFILSGVITFETLASALAMTPAALSELWEELPMADLHLASRLSLTRQQVINLRKSARKRLSTRVRKKLAESHKMEQ